MLDTWLVNIIPKIEQTHSSLEIPVFSFWNIEMLFYSSSPHPAISFYNEPPYPLKIYSTINKEMAWIEEFLVNYWVNKRNNRKNCRSMQNVLSWFKALKSHALSERLMQTNSILHSHAKASISHPFKVSY